MLFAPTVYEIMNKFYSSHSILAAIVITKIALPATITQNCDSAIKLKSWCEITAKKRI
ncbi:hypothetical protein E2Q31_20920 [Salmonella enterica subsp. enterica serovar Oranienburg]|uniref:Uncharacterized protein n=1 Tax=Salmonella oranienberg TaxID=28147 RepID=A0A5I0ZW94_SALON|nr:hypothetical protein [Salmonella enterica subsp. enterica serovar Oranienburg]EAB1741072.1 hypothetical protein [Salmonella enterica]EAA1729278.1 hypothetical protein [Salmonella enterica subsp. enterica serovar Oranienburg]EAA2764600.1 hypothetical protein [Salmonella enterica subsp. enterica serovar Oranienburg]EAA4897031.1 hypothetical protein [Salmonella enterica subsp. enterica serovar Oranienburg]